MTLERLWVVLPMALDGVWIILLGWLAWKSAWDEWVNILFAFYVFLFLTELGRLVPRGSGWSADLAFMASVMLALVPAAALVAIVRGVRRKMRYCTVAGALSLLMAVPIFLVLVDIKAFLG